MLKDSVWLSGLHAVEAKLSWELTWKKRGHEECGIEGKEKDVYMNFENSTLMETLCLSFVLAQYLELMLKLVRVIWFCEQCSVLI